MTPQLVMTLTVIAVMVVGLIRYPQAIDIIFLGAVGIFALVGIITPEQAFAGFANEAVLTIGALFVVAAGVVETGLLNAATRRILGSVKSPQRAIAHIIPPVIGLSAFLNNTAVVAMSIPPLLDWCRKRRIAASKLLIPLSYAAILGGTCTLIGTSANLVVHGMLRNAGFEGFGMWELGKAGIPIAAAGSVLLVVLGTRLLPERKEFLEQLGESRREFLVEMQVRVGCPLIGQTIPEAGLRHLPGLFLVKIERNGQRIAPVGPQERLQIGDRLVFTGIVSTIVDLQKIPGLVPAVEDHTAFDTSGQRGLFEAVISASSPLVGRGIREANFRTIYDAAVIAVHRNGERLRQKIGDIVLLAGDTLLLLTGTGFVRAHRNNPDFYLVSEAGVSAPERREKAPLAAAIAIAMVALLTVPDLLSAFNVGEAAGSSWKNASAWMADRRVVFAMLAAGAMIVTRCVPPSVARRRIEWQVLLVVGSAFGIGAAMSESGAAAAIAGAFGHLEGLGPLAVLAAIYLTTWVLTEVMTHTAAAALMFPIAIAAAQGIGSDVRPFAVAVALAASSGFVLPSGYQTHLMVFGPGGYRPGDFAKTGFPMVLLWFLMSMILIPVMWPFRN